ncbi:phospholipase D-like domain-containing protein [Desulfofundulus salinus]|uniref:PLD phosphodiesterase domain-containing protein n=1 Tax=Desulfofundulus salinus TaxID=2419843 RepID=A0A494WXT2_9FIRM|nr:phospholipase D-like domain-containing protein [Desulfofundulus salinum]RKO67803.1 hypothetical protein D7024_13190 [Desulfofundulus salinum]
MASSVWNEGLSGLRKETLESLDLLLRILPAQKIKLLADALEKGRLHHHSPSVSVASELDISGQALGAAVRFLRSASDSLVLCTALRTASYFLNVANREKERVDLVWTGPVNISIPARSTREILCEMAERATRSIDLVGYSLTSGCESIIEALARARRRGVQRIRILADRLEQRLPVLNAMWPEDVTPPEYFTRPEDSSDPMTSLHAKLMLVDDRDLLVTSANLTYHGLGANIEVGLRVTGKTGQKVAELLNSLIGRGEVRKITAQGEDHEL